MLPLTVNPSGNLTISDVLNEWSGWILLIGASYLVVALIAATLVARKAGYSHWLGVIAVAVPVVGAVFILLFAFVKWPALKERDAAKALLKKNGLLTEPAPPADALPDTNEGKK